MGVRWSEEGEEMTLIACTVIIILVQFLLWLDDRKWQEEMKALSRAQQEQQMKELERIYSHD